MLFDQSSQIGVREGARGFRGWVSSGPTQRQPSAPQQAHVSMHYMTTAHRPVNTAAHATLCVRLTACWSISLLQE